MKIHRLQIKAVAEALLSVFRDGLYADKVIERRLRTERQWGARDRRFFAEMTYDSIRWWRRLNAAAGRPEMGAAPGVIEGLRESEAEQVIKVYLVIKSELQLPEWLSVDDGTSRLWRSRWESLEQPPAVRHSLPDWLETHAAREIGGEWPQVIDALNGPAPVYLRANRLKADRYEVALRLEAEGIKAIAVPEAEDGLVLEERKNVFATKAFKEGLFEVQDGGSQQIVPLLGPQPGERVIDACAGAGGKTLHIAARMKNRGKVLALDVHSRKLEELKLRSRRAGAGIVETREISSTKVIKRLAESADRVLLDVPCSGSGVWRRNPDGRWKLTLEETDRLAELQSRILADYSRMVKPGGVLVYATCSLWPSENQKQVRRFLDDSSNRFVLEQELNTSPHGTGFDGFYAARLRKALS